MISSACCASSSRTDRETDQFEEKLAATFILTARRALPAIILGGLDSVPGAIIGGLIIGLSENLAVAWAAGP